MTSSVATAGRRGQIDRARGVVGQRVLYRFTFGRDQSGPYAKILRVPGIRWTSGKNTDGR